MTANFSIAVLAQRNVVIDYGHRVITCGWLAGEYDKIIDRNAAGLEAKSHPDVTRVRILSWPMFALTGKIFFDDDELLPPAPDIGGTVNFTGHIDHVGEAAKKKNCYQLYDRYIQHQREGKHNELQPAPLASPIGTAPE